MKSRTSSCKMRVFKKDITRFAPIWVEYSVLLIVIFYFLWSGKTDITDRYSWFVSIFAYVNAIYGFICAVGLFGYLSDPRECNAVHAFPIRREEYFLVHVVAGFLMALVPNFLFCVANLLLVSGNPFVTFGGMMLQFTFFYSLAIFCVFLTGRKFAAATMYALLNWISVLVMWALETIYLPMLPGIKLNTDVFFNFCPVVMMSFSDLYQFNVWNGVPSQQMQVMIIYAIVGVALLMVSLVMYRKRRLEYAGDFIAVKWLTPVFVVALSIAFGCALAAFGSLFDNDYPIMLAVGLIVGYFTGMMLLKRTIKVFDLKSIAGAVAVLAVIFGSLFITQMDPFGRVYHIPEADQVASVEIRHDYENSEKYESDDPAVIADVLALHEDILKQDEFVKFIDGDGYNVTYYLKSGQKMVRSYVLNTTDLLERGHYYFSQPEMMVNVETLEELKKNCRNVTIYDQSDYNGSEVTLDNKVNLDNEDMAAFLEVFFRECKEGKTSHYTDISEKQIYVEIFMQKGDDGDYYWIPLPETAEDTLALCEELIAREQNVQQS